MAINYLNSIDLNKNELLQGVIENQPNDAAAGSSPVKGQLYFNTTNNVLKQYNGTSWEEVGGGVETITTTDGTYIDLTPNSATSGAVTVTADLSASDGTAVAATRFLTKDNTWATVPQGDITEVQGGTYISVTNQTGPIPIVNHDLTTRGDTTSTDSPGYAGTFTVVDSVTTNTTGHVTALNVKTVTMPSVEAYTFSVTADSGTNQVINSGNTLDIAGGTNITTVVGATDTVTVNLNDSITLAGELTVSGTGQSSVAGQLTIPQVPSADTDAASKHYVDQAVTGALSYQGGYNAATNTPDLDSSPSSAIKKGWTYTVTADGLFFTEQVRVGDVLIAEQDAPTTLANWTTVQNNIDLADASTVGISNVVPGSSNTVTAPYTSGTATLDVVNSSASQKGAVIVAGGTGISVAYASGTATVTNTETNSSNTATGTITAGNLSGTVTHNFGTLNTIVQTIDSSGDTVFCDITRTSNTSVATISATQASNITILVQKIG